MAENQTLKVNSTERLELTCPDWTVMTVKNTGPDTVYYDDVRTVSSVSNDGSIASGSSISFVASKHFISAGRSRLQVSTPDRFEAVEARFGYVSVKQFGARGDGVQDDTAEIQAAIDWAAANGANVFFPAGVYLVSSAITLKYRVNLRGTGQAFHEAKDLSSTLRSTLKLAAGSECHLLQTDTAGPVRGGQAIDHTFQRSVIEGLNFDGNKSNQTATDKALLYCYRIWSLSVRNCNFDNAPGDGIWLDDTNAVNIYDSYCCEADRSGIYLKDTADTFISGVEVFGAKGPGLLLDNSWKNVISGLFGNAVTSVDAVTTGIEHGIVLQNGSTSNIISGRSDQNLLDGVYIDATSRSNVIDVVTLENGWNNATGRAGFRIAGDDNIVRGTADLSGNLAENQDYGVVLEAGATGNRIEVTVDSAHATDYDYSALSAAVGRAQIPSEQLEHLVASTTPTWIPASGFGLIQGTPALSTVGGGRRVAWLFDASTDESVSASFRVPSGWAGVKFTVFHTNAGAGSGNVFWSVQGKSFAVAANLDVADNSHDATVAAPAQDVLASLSTSATTLAATENTLYTVRIKRVASDGADTLANDAALLGVLVEKQS